MQRTKTAKHLIKINKTKENKIKITGIEACYTNTLTIINQ